MACEEDGVFLPEYTIHPGDIMIKFTAPENRIVRSTTFRVVDKVVDKVVDIEDQVLSCLQEDPAYTYADLANKIGVSKKTIFQKIKSLKEKNKIVRIGSDIKGYWQITDKQ